MIPIVEVVVAGTRGHQPAAAGAGAGSGAGAGARDGRRSAEGVAPTHRWVIQAEAFVRLVEEALVRVWVELKAHGVFEGNGRFVIATSAHKTPAASVGVEVLIHLLQRAEQLGLARGTAAEPPALGGRLDDLVSDRTTLHVRAASV